MTFDLPVIYHDTLPSDRRLVRQQYVKEQGGFCYWCKCALSESPPDRVTSKKINWKKFPPNFLRYPVHLQHSHDTGLTEGAVHAYCNAVMWQYHGR